MEFSTTRSIGENLAGFPHRLALLFVVISLFIMATAGVVYLSLRDNIRDNIESDLTSVAELKTNQIVSWLNGRYSDARIHSSGALAEMIARWSAEGQRPGKLKDSIVKRLNDISRTYDYNNIVVFDQAGHTLIGTGEASSEEHHLPLILKAMSSRKPQLVTFHLQPSPTGIRSSLGIIQPLMVDGKPQGAFLYEIDPDKHLYPMIQSWPNKKRSAETLLFQIEGDHVVFLNKLRHSSKPPMTMRISLDPRVCSGKIMQGGLRGLLGSCLDYRGVPQLAYATEIRGTPWMMIAKIDESEAFSTIRQLAMTAGITLMLGLVFVGGLLELWRRQFLGRQREMRLAIDLQQERANKLLLESEQRWQFALEGAGDGVWDWDIRSGKVYFSPRWKSMAGYEIEDIGDTLTEWEKCVHPDDLPECKAELDRHLRGEVAVYQREFRMRCKDGQYKWMLERGKVTERDDTCQPVRMIGTMTDISDLKGIQEELAGHRDRLQDMVAERTTELLKAKNAAEQASEAKSVFLTNMTHEFRTPLHAIISFSRLGVEKTRGMGEAAGRLLQFFTRIEQSGDRLMKLLNDLLHLSSLEGGKIVYSMHTYGLRPLVESALQELRLLAESRNIRLDTSGLQTDLNVECDAQRIRQVLANLLLNAIRYSADGGTISVASHPINLDTGGASRPGVAITVRDEGVGIPEAELEKVFDKFEQSSATRTGAGGTGLGLPICREIIEHHGGRIFATRPPEGGACLNIEIPLVQSLETVS